jgi:hypothetical protein
MAVVVAVAGLIVWGAFKANTSHGKKVSVFLTVWITALSVVVSSNWFYKYSIPAVPILFATINLSAIIFGLSRWGRQLSTLPIWMLVAFQGFRLPLELVLHQWAAGGTIPETMTWTGQNFDIISGVCALLAILKPFRTRTYFWFFNVVGFALLLNVLRVVVMSSPLPIAWNLENPLLLIFHLPYALIAYVCVWAAIVGHIVLTRALLRKSK